MINSEGYSREKDGIYLFLEKLLKLDNIEDILKIPYGISVDILRYVENNVDLNFNKSNQITVKNVDISRCFSGEEYYLYIKYSDEDIAEIIMTVKDEHTYLLAKNFVCLFDLTDFMTKELSIADIVLDVKKSGFLKSKQWLEVNDENLNKFFAEKLKIFLQQNIPQLLTNKTYHYERGLLYTYPPLSVVFDVKDKNIFDIDDVLEIVDVVGRDNNYWNDFFERDKSDFKKHSTYLLIDYLTKNSKAKDVKPILNFLADNHHKLGLLRKGQVIYEKENFDLYKEAINKFESFLEAKIQEYFKISNSDDLAIDFNNILILKEEMFENLFDENFELKQELAFIIINKLSNDFALISFIEVFDKSKKNFDIVELQKKLERQTLNVRIEDIDLDSIEDIIYHLKQNKFFKKLFFGKIHINFTFCGEPALPAITRDTVHLLKKLKKDFGITTSVPEFLFDYLTSSRN
jgi:hypothetical protein